MIESIYQKTGYRAGLHLGGHAAAGVWLEVGAVVPAAAHALAVELETKVAKITQSFIITEKAPTVGSMSD